MSTICKDITGRRFGRLIAIRVDGDNPRRWLCQCDCGGSIVVITGQLTSGRVKSCGCLSKRKDMTGQRFGRLIAVRPHESRNGEWYWYCDCDCGGNVIAKQSKLASGSKVSCGCAHQMHGATGMPMYQLWRRILQRCRDPNDKSYKNYGGRGIGICERWLTFANFAVDILAEIGSRPSLKHEIDRIDNDGDYEPGNVRWATDAQQWEHRQPHLYRSRITVLKTIVELEKPTTPIELSVTCSMAYQSVHTLLHTLIHHGLIQKIAPGKYIATQRGQDARKYNYSIAFIAGVHT